MESRQVFRLVLSRRGSGAQERRCACSRCGECGRVWWGEDEAVCVGVVLPGCQLGSSFAVESSSSFFPDVFSDTTTTATTANGSSLTDCDYEWFKRDDADAEYSDTYAVQSVAVVCCWPVASSSNVLAIHHNADWRIPRKHHYPSFPSLCPFH